MTVTFKIEDGDGAAVVAADGESILDVAKRAGIAIDAPCGGSGTCGKCKIKLLSGEIDGSEEQHLEAAELKAGWRLACRSKPKGDVSVFIPASAQAFQSRIRITDFSGAREKAAFDKLRAELRELSLVGDYGLKSIPLELVTPTIDDAMADRERLLPLLAAALGAEEQKIEWTLFALRRLPLTLRAHDFKIACIVREDTDGRFSIIDILPQEHKPLTGLAIDIGTTTVSMLLVNLETGDPLTAASGGNAQIRYGADVINRIIESAKQKDPEFEGGTPAVSQKNGLERLRTAIIDECLSPLVRRLAVNAGLNPHEIYRVAVAGNTTMAQLFLGVPPEYLRLEPYIPPFFHSDAFSAGEIGLPVHPAAEVLLAPAVGSYVGGDITAGVFSAGFYRKDALTLFVDLGTNGELVFGSSDFMMSCACSAGPAFEGGEISCGMRATTGAIEACLIDEKTQEPKHTIIGNEGGAKAAGLCGSGLIDIIGELFRCGIVNSKGKFVVEGKRIVKDEYGGQGYVVACAAESASGRDLILSETDIDNFIRAKGAIFSAIRTMLAITDMPIDAIEQVYVAGGIGSGIDIGHAILIGMFPKIPEDKYVYIGNSSLSGAYAMLTSRGAAAEVTNIGNSMTYLELSSHPSYMDEFVAACFLPHTDATLFE